VASQPSIFGRLAMLGLHSTPTFLLHFILLLSCSLHSPNAPKVKQISFTLFESYIYLFIFEIFDFILCNDEVNMPWKRSK
jgi:hypothetical protein